MPRLKSFNKKHPIVKTHWLKTKGRVIYYQVVGRLYSGGGGRIFFFFFFFCDVLEGLKIKLPWAGGGSYISSGIWGGGVRCVPLVFAFIKSQSFWLPRPPISQMMLPTISNIQNKKRLQNKLMYCGVTMYPKTLAFYLFIVRFR